MTLNKQVPAAPDDRSFADAQAFLLLIKRYWTTQLTPALVANYRAGRLICEFEPAPKMAAPGDSHVKVDIEYFEWFERHLQRAKYSGRYGLQAWHERDRQAHELMLAQAAEQALAEGRLELDPNCSVPEAFAAVDIHQHPGGVWSDPLAGMVYERGARSTTPMAGQRHHDLHDGLADQLASDQADAGRIVDLGCGFGKSTRGVYRRLPKAEIVAVDVAVPCLKLGAAIAQSDDASQVHWRQADARDCGEPDATVDIVTSTMLLHEMPPDDLPALFREAFRILKPSGTMRHLDFLPAVQPSADDFRRCLHLGHARRNNEPFMAPLLKQDLPRLLADCGFVDVLIEPFAESDGALNPQNADWRFPWATVFARKPATI